MFANIPALVTYYPTCNHDFGNHGLEGFLFPMGAMGVEMDMPYGLNEVWGYKGTKEHMAELIDLFAYDKKFATEELITVRHEASQEPGFHEAFSSMFPHPRQSSADNLSFPDEEIKKIKHKTLLVHGREDKVVPVFLCPSKLIKVVN